MDTTSDAIEQLSFLTRSEPRVHILSRLLDGPATQRVFRDHLDTSRSTVTRSLTALEEQGWVRQDGDRYHLTPPGRIVAEGITDLIDTVRATEELSTFIEWFPVADHDLTLEQLREAEVTASTEADPYAPSRKHADALTRVSSFRMLLPSIDLQLVRSVQDRVVGGDLSIELLVPASMEATLADEEFAPVLREQIAAGGTTVRVCDRGPSFYLGLGDDGTVQVGVEDDEGFPRALLETDATDLRAWAESVYDQYRDGSRVKPVDEF
jgi:predicted transcriptional regulator